jgi:hypothetical protein
VSTKIGIVTEGSIDHVLLSALLTRISQEKANFTWPLDTEDAAELFPVRKRGHGGVVETVRRIVRALDSQTFDHACFVILLDHRTRAAQTKVRKLIAGRERFVLGIAIKEIEAWWLGDRTNTLAWTGLRDRLPESCRYGASAYHAERDDVPKRTLDELTHLSDSFDRFYGDGSMELAIEFVDNYWRPNARLDEIAAQCSGGYRPFEAKMTTQFERARRASGRLFR